MHVLYQLEKLSALVTAQAYQAYLAITGATSYWPNLQLCSCTSKQGVKTTQFFSPSRSINWP